VTPISVPLIFPKVVPSNWDTWNSIWEQNKIFIPKTQSTPNPGQVMWEGFDIFVKDGIDATDLTKYSCKNVNCPELFPSLFDNLDSLPIDVQVVRVLNSLSKVPPHRDFLVETNYNAVRSFLCDNNSKQTWWYETDQTKSYLSLPEETNTWWYNDLRVKHATDFYPGHSKQLIMYRGTLKEDLMSSILRDSMQKYSDYIIYI
jgi:hypothetical protein